MDWEECKTRRLVKETETDEHLIASLIKQSDKNLITDKFSPLNEDTASTKISNNYDALREILEAVAIKNGFKIYNHECFSGFLKEVLELENEALEFDNLRKIRNSINYYGEDYSVEDSKSLIREINDLRESMKKYLENGNVKRH